MTFFQEKLKALVKVKMFAALGYSWLEPDARNFNGFTTAL